MSSTPAGTGPDRGDRLRHAQGVSFYRGTLPLPIGTAGARAGKWHALLTVDETYYKRYLSTLDRYPDWYQSVLAHGIRYSLSVQSYSGLRLQGRLLQTSLEPGATLTVRAVLTEYGLPIPGTGPRSGPSTAGRTAPRGCWPSSKPTSARASTPARRLRAVAGRVPVPGAGQRLDHARSGLHP